MVWHMVRYKNISEFTRVFFSVVLSCHMIHRSPQLFFSHAYHECMLCFHFLTILVVLHCIQQGLLTSYAFLKLA